MSEAVESHASSPRSWEKSFHAPENDAGWSGSPIALLTTSSGRMPSARSRCSLRDPVALECPFYEVRHGEIASAGHRLRRAEVELPIGGCKRLTDVDGIINVGPSKAETSSRRRPRPRARWTAASHGSVPATTSRILTQAQRR